MTFSPAPVTCHITTNGADGTSSLMPLSAPPIMTLGPVQYTYIYSTAPGPSWLSNNADLATYDAAKASKPLPMYPPNGGSNAAILDFAPDPTGGEGYMHRTQTLDYAFMMEGEMELTMDGGERRTVKKGDVVVQRAVMHTWRNLSKTEPARMAVVSLGCGKVMMGDVELKTA